MGWFLTEYFNRVMRIRKERTMAQTNTVAVTAMVLTGMDLLNRRVEVHRRRAVCAKPRAFKEAEVERWLDRSS